VNRRSFLGSALAVPLVAGQSKVEGIQETLPGLSKARWLEDGLIDAGGSHEGYLFTVRRLGQSLSNCSALAIVPVSGSVLARRHGTHENTV
jgi:hypothetical protein